MKYVSSIVFHTAFQSILVWNTIDDTYSNFVLYMVTKPHFLIFVSFQSIFTMAVWNTIDDRYFNFCFMQKRSQIFIFAILESIFNRTVWNTIGDRFSNFVLPYIETKPHFLIFTSFERFLVCQCGILSMIYTPTLSSI